MIANIVATMIPISWQIRATIMENLFFSENFGRATAASQYFLQVVDYNDDSDDNDEDNDDND